MWVYWLIFGLIVGDSSIRADHISTIDCGFEDVSICGYTQEKSHVDVEFVRTNQQSKSRQLSSSAGITSSSQGTWYVYMKCGSGTNDQYASLISPVEQPIFKKCLQFSYNMHGSDVFALKVFIKTAVGWDDAIWRQNLNQGADWITAVIPITSFQPFQIVFQGHVRVAPNCDIGVDDVKINDCPDAVLNDSDTYESWTQWKKCDQSCGANYRSRARFWFSRETKQPYNFTYHIRYITANKTCPEENRWYFDDLKDGHFNDEYGKVSATVVSGTMESSEGLLTVKTGQESVKFTFPYDSCIFGVKECEDGFTLSFWINLQESTGGSSILSPDNSKGIRITLVDSVTVNIVMDINDKQWSINTSITTDTWTYMTITWSACHGLTYYENGQVKEHLGIFKTKLGVGSPEPVGKKSLFIGKSRSADSALFSMIEFVIWNGMISPADIKALYVKVDQTERFMFLKTDDKRRLQWKKSYTGTLSSDTGPSFTYLRSEFDMENEDFKPASCQHISLMGKGDVDGYYVIFPRGACGDSLKVWCFGMNGLSPKEYIDIDSALNYGVRAGLDPPCEQASYGGRGKTWFNKIRVFPNQMIVAISDTQFTTFIENYVNYGVGGACYDGTYDATCTHSGHFNIDLKNTSVRVKPTVNWKGSGYWVPSDFPKMVNFRRSPDSREISGNCGGYCGSCSPDGGLILELASCVQKKPSSCADVKYYQNINLDGNYTIYPYTAGQLPIRVYCTRMNTSEPKEYINLLQSKEKNFALINGDIAYHATCDIEPNAPPHTSVSPMVGRTQYSKIRLDIKHMAVIRWDDSFGNNVFGTNVTYGRAGSCFSRALCLPRGLFNIDLTGTGLRVKSNVSWYRTGWKARNVVLYTIHEDLYTQVIDANCGAYCGFCYPTGETLYLEVVVPHRHLSYFGREMSLMDTSDQGKSKRNLELSNVCSEAVGLEDGRIPDSSFSASSFFDVLNEATKARLNNIYGWRAKDDELKPWLQIDLLFVNLVTGFATHGNTNKYLKTYFVSFGFVADQLMVYLNDLKQQIVFNKKKIADTVEKHVLHRPFFARHVRFTLLTWEGSAKMKAEIYVCPRASYHHMVMSGDFHYLDSSYPVDKGDRGELVTRIMPPVYTCARFKYHMVGSHMGRLDVYVDVNGERQLLWSVVGEQKSNAWMKAEIPLQVNAAFKMVFAGMVGDGYKSDIAVGAVSLMNDTNCSFSPSHALRGFSCDCVSRSKCDNVTGKCLCFDEEFVGEECQNKLLKSIYQEAFHYWSFDNPENIIDLKTGVGSTKINVPVSYERGPINLALLTKSTEKSGLKLGEIKYLCLKDPSVCPEGLTITAWIKGGDPRNKEFYFRTTLSGGLGVILVSLPDKFRLSYKVKGTKHDCNLDHVFRSYGTWMFVVTTWAIQPDNSGKLVFDLIHAMGVKREEKVCPESISSFQPSLGRMEILLLIPFNGFSIDELAVWNASLTEDRIIDLYNLVTRNFSNYITWNFKLESYSWSRALVDREDSEHNSSIDELNSLIGKYINNTSVKRIWEEFETDKCIYAGFVRDGVVTWREDVMLYCNDSRFQSKNEYFSMRLDVKDGDVQVNLNNIKLGSFLTEGETIARGGFFGTKKGSSCTVKTTSGTCCALPFYYRDLLYETCTTLEYGTTLWCSTTTIYISGGWGVCVIDEEPQIEISNDVMVKAFSLEANQGTYFTFEECDMTHSGPTENEGEYRLRGTQTTTYSARCMAIYNRPVLSRRYKIEARFRHEHGTKNGNGQEVSHMGILFKYKNRDNYIMINVRCREVVGGCFTFFHREHGTNHQGISGDCIGGTPGKRVWHTLTVHVDVNKIEAFLDGSLLLKTIRPFDPQPSQVGAFVHNSHEITATFKEFRVEEYFVPISSFLNTRTFQLPFIEDIVDRHEMKLMLGDQVSSVDNYTVSAEFRYTTDDFGLCYNVKNDTNFEFLYYRRKRILYAEVTQSVITTSWKQNEIVEKEIENSTFVLMSRSSMKVPTHIPYNISSTAINSTALNVSWHWLPDYDVTGVFQGFKILYRTQEDPEESWEEKVIYGQEFQNVSFVILNDLRKYMAYYLKVVAFSLIGDGWPSKEILNSTHEDIPEMINLNATVQNVDLQSVLVKWDRLPKYYWNSPEPSYVVLFQNLARDINISVQVPPGTTQLNYTQLKHFTNYSVSLMAISRVGVSLPTEAGVIETLEHVPAVYPSNFSVIALNTRTLAVSWSHIDDELWQGMPLGYVIYCNHSNDQRNFTVEDVSTKNIVIANFTGFTFYDLTIAGYTRKGLGPKHPIVTIRTSEDVPEMINLNATVQNVDLQSVLVKWDRLPKYYWNSFEPSYVVLFQDLARDINISVQVPPGTTQLNYTQLKHFTNYSVSLMAMNRVGVSLPIETGVIETLEHVPAVYPSNFSVTVLNTSALTVTWSHIDEDLWQGVPMGYVIYCNHSNNQRNFNVMLSSKEIMITNLTVFTYYDLTMAGYTRKGLGPKHPMVTVRTHEEVPRIPPINLRLHDGPTNYIPNNTNITSPIPSPTYSTILEWDPVPADEVRGIIRGYTVTYQPLEIFYITRARRSVADLRHVVNTSSNSAELDDLLFYTNYSAHVQAYTVDNGVPSSQFLFMTPEGVPSAGPENLQANNDGWKSKLFVKWDSVAVDARNGILLGYNVYHQESSVSSTINKVSVTATSIVLTGLEAYTSCDIRVCGFTAVGEGVCSEVTAMTRSHDIAPYTAPWNVTTVLTSPLSISLLWEPFPDSLWFDYPRGYRITFQRVALGGIPTSGDDVTIEQVGYRTGSYSWTNLQYYTKYKIEISTITYRGYGPKAVVYAETCDCPPRMASTYQILSPYVMKSPDGKLGGILPQIIQRMTSSCCGTCSGTVVDFDQDGLGEISEKDTYPDLLKSLHQSTSFAFPIVGFAGTNKYKFPFGFIPAVEAPGMVVIVKKKSAENIALTVLWSVFKVWPILLMNIVLALIAGIIMWMLDSRSNEDIFPRTCIRGCAEGFWWAFISMTTVGYGDTTAKSIPGRIFAVIWILTGLCLYSILIGDLSSALSATVSVSKTALYGAKVAVLINSTEESVALQQNAKIVGGPYYTLEEIQKAVLNGKVDAAIIDIYAAGLTKKLWNHTDLRMSQMLDFPAPYGIVISDGIDGVQRCFENYVKNNRIKTLELIINYTTTLKGIKNEEPKEYVANLIDGQSTLFRQTLLILCVGYGVLFLLGMIWHFTCRRRRSTSRNKDNSVHPETTPENEIVKELKTSCLDISHRLKKVKRRHYEEIRKLVLKKRTESPKS